MSARLRLGTVVGAAFLAMSSLSVAHGPSAQADPYATSASGAPLALTPPMGWNNWAYYGCDANVPNAGDAGPTQALLMEQAQALVGTGLKDRGYNTLTIDDCWMTHSRDAAGNLVVDGTKFPNGMKWLGDQLHSMGLKFGIYGDIGSSTCGGYPGSFGHFQQDVNQWAGWGVDYIKLDGCNMPGQYANKDGYIQQYAAFGQAIKANSSKRDIVYSISAPAYFSIGVSNLNNWYDVIDASSKQGQLWRNGFDVRMRGHNASAWNYGGNGAGVLTQYEYNSRLARYSAPGGWNDPDFLITGVGLTDEESKTQIAQWAMMASPLILSVDVTKISAANLAALKNPDVVAVDQDSLGKAAGIVAQNGTSDILTRPLSNGDIAMSMMNRSGAAVQVTTSLTGLGFAAGCTAVSKDLWTGGSATTDGPLTTSVPAHGTKIYRITPGANCGKQVPTGQLTGLAGKCLDVHGSQSADGTPAELYHCTGGTNQRWTLHADGTVRSLGKCLDATQASDGLYTANIRTCSGAASQRWAYQRNGNLKNVGLARCLDVYASQSADSTRVLADTCGSSEPNQANQLWSLPVA